MTAELPSTRRNLFEIDNARNLNTRELVETFVPTQSFWRLLSSKHHVVLGSRGSGKTAVAKMLSHDHLSLLNNPKAKAIVRLQQFIGVYVPTRLEWVGALKNKPWQTDLQKEQLFQWRLNLSSCLALISTIESCIKCYSGNRGEQARAEIRVVKELSESWAESPDLLTLDELRNHLQDLEYRKHLVIASGRATGDLQPSGNGPGIAFEADLFVPLKRGIELASRALSLKKDSTWLVCIDEAEFLEELHHRILNSHLRAYSGNIYFKITTMPYCHYTLSTNTQVSLDVGHDFEYVYIDFDPVLFARTRGEKASIGTAFARRLFDMRIQASGALSLQPPENKTKKISIDEFLNGSELLDDKDADWASDSRMMKLLRKYCSEATIKRAEELIGKPNFKPTISRKIHGALLLRDAYDELKGRGEVDVYSGATMVIRCGDTNPRRIIRIYNGLLLAAQQSFDQDKLLPRLSRKAQTRVLRKLSTSYLERVQSEPEVGKELYDLIKMIGNHMKTAFHERPLSTDHISSVIVDESVPERFWTLIQRAVQLGLLSPNLGPQQRGELPHRSGTFHLAFVLAPHFFLLPRRGHARNLLSILQEEGNPEQLKLF